MTDKIITVAMLFIVIMTIGYFGQKMGYTVEGAERGAEAVQTEWRDADYGLDVVFSFWADKFKDNAIGTGVKCIEYVYNFATLRIDNIPDWLVIIVDFLAFLALVVIFLFIRGG